MSFSIPDGVWRATEALRNGSSRIPRRRDFAAAVAGVEASQPFRAGSAAGRSQPEAQAEYYKAYAGARFAVTSKKGGWDCLRHYEIVLAGAMPFFLGIDELPPAAMPTWPRDIVRHAMALPGVPSEAAVSAAVGAGARLPPIDRSRFPQAEYEKLRRSSSTTRRRTCSPRTPRDACCSPRRARRRRRRHFRARTCSCTASARRARTTSATCW